MQLHNQICPNERDIVRLVFAAATVAFTLLTVGCSSDATVPVTAKVSAPSAHAELRPLPSEKNAPMSSTEGLSPECAIGQQTVLISANKTRDFIDVDNTGVVVKTSGVTAPHTGASATYEFTKAQPRVRAVFVTVKTNGKYDDHTGLVIQAVTHHYRANWPLQASMLPTAVSVDANNFIIGSSLVGIMFCRR